MSLLATIRRELSEVADPLRAKGAQAYMKSEMPFLGVGAVPLRAACSKVFSDLPIPGAAVWHGHVLDLWRGARYREERYAAIELTGVKKARPFQTLDTLPMYEEMVVDGAWWDYVDTLAKHRLGELLRRYPKEMKSTMLAWSRDENLWRRRSAILCQLGFKDETDLGLLYACIEPSIGSKEFFLRKGIGWALRQYAWTDPEEIRRYVEKNRERLSGLTIREALKNCG
jgi:3-methyladenine DNA glycosylase AlkD